MKFASDFSSQSQLISEIVSFVTQICFFLLAHLEMHSLLGLRILETYFRKLCVSLIEGEYRQEKCLYYESGGYSEVKCAFCTQLHSEIILDCLHKFYIHVNST